jgi:PTS system mannose-specific IIA component
MNAVVVATHGEYGSAMVQTLKMILGEIDQLQSVTLALEDSMETFQEKLEKTLQTLDPEGKGALVLVDMLGGTPFNVAIQTAQRHKIAVVTGVNLPMLIKITSSPDQEDLQAFAREVQKAARESIKTSAELFNPP